MASVSYGSLPFQEQIEFIRGKLDIPTNAWTDFYAGENDWGFAVAGANRNDLVADFHTAIDKVVDDGGTIADFRRDFDSIVEQFGWDYNGGRNWRTRVIYQTNLYQSYNAGRAQQLDANQDALPFRRYRHSPAVEDPREEHLAWDGLVLRADDPWWDTHMPMNGWGCQCYVEGVTEDDLEDLGKSGPDTAPDIEWETREIGQRSPGGPFRVRVPKGVDPGFEHSPGKSRLKSAVPGELPDVPSTGAGAPGLPNRRPGDELPAARSVDAEALLPEDLTDEAYTADFLDRFDATLDSPAVYTDVVGEALVVGADLFRNRRTGQLDANKEGRGRYLPLLAEAIQNPDEVWLRLERSGTNEDLVVRRRYLARFDLPGEDMPALALGETGNDGWGAVMALQDQVDEYLENARVGIRLYRRSE